MTRLVWGVGRCAAMVAVAVACADFSAPEANLPGDARAAKGGGDSPGGNGGVTVSSAKPDTASQGTTLDVTISGSGFTSDMDATWELDGVSYPDQVRTNSTRYVNSKQLVANITISADATPEQWDIRVQSRVCCKGGVGLEKFQIKAVGSDVYQLQFIIEDETQGEITSSPFPVGGVRLNLKDPWSVLDVNGAEWTFSNHTRGVQGQGTCTYNQDVNVNWDIPGTAPVRSFAGTWVGSVSFSRQKGKNLRGPQNAMNFYMVGERPGNPAAKIGNIASNWNVVEETRSGDASWFRIRFRNSRLGFGSGSSPDGQGTLFDLPGYESACANFTVEAVRIH